MSRKELANQRVLKAISLGLATALTMMTPMTAFATEGQNAEPEATAPEQVQNAEAQEVKVETTLEESAEALSAAASAIDSAAASSSDAAVEEGKELVTVTTPVSDETIAEGFADLADMLKNTELEEGKKFTDIPDVDKTVADKIDAATEIIADVATEQQDILDDLDDLNSDIDDKINDVADMVNDENEADITKEAADRAEELAKKAVDSADINDHLATYAAISATEEAYNEALANQEKAEADLEQASDDYETLAEAYNALSERYAQLLLDEEAAADEVTAAREALEAKKAELKTAEEAVEADLEALKAAKEYTLQQAYELMIECAKASEKFSPYTVKEGETFGSENASMDYWKNSLEYFKLYMAYALDADESSFEWVKTKQNLDGTDNDYGFTGASYLKYTTMDADGQEVVKYYNYHIADGDGNIAIYEKQFTTEDEIQAVEAKDAVYEWKNGDKSYEIKDDDIVVDVVGDDPEAPAVKWVKDAEDKKSLANDKRDSFAEYKATLTNNDSTKTEASIVKDTENTTYSIGNITVVDTWNKKKADEVAGGTTVGGKFFDFKASSQTMDEIKDYLSNNPNCVAEVSYNGKTVDIDNQSGWDEFWRNVGSGLLGWLFDDLKYDVKYYPLVDDLSSPKDTHEETGIIETRTAQVKTTTVMSYSGSNLDQDFWTDFDYSSRDAAIAAAKADAARKEITLLDTEIDIAENSRKKYIVGGSEVKTYGWSYNVTRSSTSTKTQEISTQAYSATQYTFTKTADAVEGVEYKAARNYWTSEIADPSNDEKVKSAINNVLADLKTIEDKETKAAAVNEQVEAAYNKVKEAEEVLKALGNNGLSDALLEAAQKLEEAKANLNEAIELKEAIDADVLRAKAAYDLAVAQTGKLYTPVNGEGNPGGEDEGTVVIPGNPTQRTSNPISPEQQALLDRYYAALAAQNQAEVLGANRDRVAAAQKLTKKTAGGDGAVVADDGDEEVKEVVTEEVKPEVEEKVTPDETEGAVVDIQDTETPLAGSLTEEEKAGMSWWWLLIVAALGTTGVVMYRNYQKKKAATEKINK